MLLYGVRKLRGVGRKGSFVFSRSLILKTLSFFYQKYVGKQKDKLFDEIFGIAGIRYLCTGLENFYDSPVASHTFTPVLASARNVLF